MDLKERVEAYVGLWNKVRQERNIVLQLYSQKLKTNEKRKLKIKVRGRKLGLATKNCYFSFQDQVGGSKLTITPVPNTY